MADLHYQELNLMQILDVLREGGVARLALSEDGQPYVVPMLFQLEVRRAQPILHLASPAAGRKMDILRRSDKVCLEVERPGCAWFEVVLAEGRATLGAAGEAGAEICVYPHNLSGRRFFLTP
ncbi:MAG: pyridoxamine 5'-phosphate oxidase family protein [Clostridia bacterium]|nr:pyridoxamine 5'-phosphate oxidase family protein [Clostridia bacterium]